MNSIFQYLSDSDILSLVTSDQEFTLNNYYSESEIEILQDRYPNLQILHQTVFPPLIPTSNQRGINWIYFYFGLLSYLGLIKIVGVNGIPVPATPGICEDACPVEFLDFQYSFPTMTFPELVKLAKQQFQDLYGPLDDTTLFRHSLEYAWQIINGKTVPEEITIIGHNTIIPGYDNDQFLPLILPLVLEARLDPNWSFQQFLNAYFLLKEQKFISIPTKMIYDGNLHIYFE